MTPIDSTEYTRWRENANDALRGARAQRQVGVHNWACFSSEQAAQLAVKGLLHGIGRGPWGHDLVELSLRFEDEIQIPDDVRTALLRLSHFYIQTRYPDAHAGGLVGDRYGEPESAAALSDAERVMRWVDETWEALQ